ncbi:sulfide:quinone oxidoreductase, mitochondrial [Phthorimaea operculella]|nr:sulfide:quinone oxidoreductase, mitochondrial [Phthorimaea operculella]
MSNIGLRLSIKSSLSWVNCRMFSASTTNNKSYDCKLLVVGGGSGGCTMANKFANHKETKGSVIIVEPSSDHYYQPLWTLVGAGVKTLQQTRRDMKAVLPTGPLWIQDHAEMIFPEQNQVRTRSDDVINYEYIIVAVGLVYDYARVPGLTQALDDPSSGVSTIYDSAYVGKVWKDLREFKGGDAIFTYPDTPIKCPGAPQKIAYLTDAFLRKKGIRENANITYNTHLPVIFGVKKYADALLKVVERKDINVNYKHVLKSVDHHNKEATFKVGDGEEVNFNYDMLHAVPPMVTPDFIYKNEELTDDSGFLDVDKHTLQSTKYPNVFGIGDCTTTPNSKTAAAIAKQSLVVEQNLLLQMAGKPLTYSYDGYGACPLLTEYGKCILAEFLYGGKVHETFPFDQSNETTVAYYMKKDLFPFIYWNFMLKGKYHGPEWVRRIVNPFAK